ncbi:MAG: type IV secretory system conjugative DNA transfer family protein [Actinomycetota bacterium]
METVNEPTPFPTPTGPLSSFLADPEAFYRHLLRTAVSFASEAPQVLAAVGAAAAVLLVAALLLLRARDRRLLSGARRIVILPPPALEPKGAQAFWMGMHALLRPWWKRLLLGQTHLSWEFTARPEEVEISLWLPDVVPPRLVEQAIEAAWPGARAVRGEGDPLSVAKPTALTELRLAQPDWFPLGAGPGDDPLKLVLAALTGLDTGEEAVIQVLARPATSSRRRRLLNAARALRAGGRPGKLMWRAARTGATARPAPDPAADADVRAVLSKASAPLFHCLIRVAVTSPTKDAARGRIASIAGAFCVFEGRNGFRRRRVRGAAGLASRGLSASSYLLSAPELSQIATMPASESMPGLERAGARSAPPTRMLPSEGKVLGRADHPASDRTVAISVEDARHHLHVVGSTGTGKSTLLAQLVLQDAAAKRAAVVIDPKGDLVEAILERLPRGSEERTCLLDPEDPEWAVGLDPLRGENHHQVVDHIVGAFQRIYEDHWGPRTDYVMRAICRTLKQIPGATLAEAPILLRDAAWRRELRYRLDHIPALATFWGWYESLPQRTQSELVGPLLNKLGPFDLSGPVQAIIGQPRPKRNIENLIDLGGLLLVRIPKGTLGEATSRLIGAFVIARIWQACMKRASRPEPERADATLYVDEFHNYLSLPRSFEDLLAEARGYRLSLVLAHQHMGQLSKDMREALAANARTKIAFAVSPEDAVFLERPFSPVLSAHDLSHLGAYQAACRPCVGGGHGRVFTLSTEPLPPGDAARAEKVREASAEVFATRRSTVEAKILERQTRAKDILLPEPPPPPGRSGGQLGGQSGGQPGGLP